MRSYYLCLLFSFLFLNNTFSQFKEIKDRPQISIEAPQLNMQLWNKKHTGTNPTGKAYTFNSIPFDNSNELDIQQVLMDQGQAVFIRADLKPEFSSRSLNEQSLMFLNGVKNHLRIKDALTEFKFQSIQEDAVGMTHIKVQQQFNGIPVYGSELILHARENRIQTLTGRSYPSPDAIDFEENISKTEAQRIVKAVFTKNNSYIELSPEDQEFYNIEQWKQKLMIYHPNFDIGLPQLCWHVQVYANLVDRWEYFINAQTGEIVGGYKNMCSFHNHDFSDVCLDGPATANAQDLLGQTRTINTYDIGGTFFMLDISRSMYNASLSNLPEQPFGAIWTLDALNTSPENSDFSVAHNTASGNNWTGQNSAVSAHYNAGLAYEYFKNTHGRESINGNGGNIVSIINVAEKNGQGMDNAFWNGAAMFYGNGDAAFTAPLAKSLDVGGHEIAHGVVQTSANLEYFGESGALNESFADIFGAMIDRDDWTIGEDIVNTNFFPSGALRDMEDPHNGAATNDFNSGWQPKKYSERFTGSADNNGVHFNSGIPNHAFFLIATAIGKEKAEKIFYRALTQYLTKSSKFIDLRIAVLQSAGDLYGNTEVDAAAAAFNTVEIGEGEGGNYEEEVIENPGSDFLVFSDEQRSQLILTTSDGTVLANPLSSTAPISRPSVTDDGTSIVFVGSDNHIHRVNIDWQNSTFDEDILSSNPEWFNVAISKDGTKIGAVLNNTDPLIWIFDLNGISQSFTLENPTTADGVATGDVLYADAMEFDFNNEWLMYDAANRIEGDFGEDIEYWDISFINVWDNSSNNFASGRVSKLFSGLPENISIGNPTFSSNAPFIIAFDLIELVDEINNTFNYSIWGANIESQQAAQIFSNTTLGYPSYSKDDQKIIYNFETIHLDVGVSDLLPSRIEGVPNSENIIIPQAGWAVWFSNGIRDYNTPVLDLENQLEGVKVYPNPSNGNYTLDFEWEASDVGIIDVYDVLGMRLFSKEINVSGGNNSIEIDLSQLSAGNYIVKLKINNRINSQMIGKY
jgi:Zn-dependent metalloprotease